MSDNPELLTYAQAMELGTPFIRLKMDIDEPVEIGDFVSAFLAISAQFDRFSSQQHPKSSGGARLFVREVRVGCIEADLVPYATGVLKLAGGILAAMVAANTVHDFVEKWGGTLKRLGGRKGERLEGASKAELQTVMQQVAAVASVPGSKLEISAITSSAGSEEVTVFRAISSSEAQIVTDNAEEQRRELQQTTDADHSRVLMRFTHTDTRKGKIGKRTVEQACIEAVSPKELPVIYASDLAEQRIRHEIVSENENVYWKGFVVDVNVEFSRGKPAAYRVTHVHQVIDLPRDS
jgi:hypothetical protein